MAHGISRIIRPMRWVMACLFLPWIAPLQAGEFSACVAALRTRAIRENIGPDTLARTLDLARPMARVIRSDRAQPEQRESFWHYLNKRVTPQRVQTGREMLVRHARLLRRIEADFRVKPQFLVAFWALETNFGTFYGNTPVISALTTLACDTRRSARFADELMQALEIVQHDGIDPGKMLGSWAGAMGHVQFMPSVFVRYAVDYDHDGRRDLWGSLPDALASAANYLHQLGWQDGERWGREISLQANFPWELAGVGKARPLLQWAKLGVRTTSGDPLPDAHLDAALLLPAGQEGPAFLVYRNFQVIMQWNRSLSYALAVGYLSDRIAGLGRLAAIPRLHDMPVTRNEIQRIQSLLGKLGFSPGQADGIPGQATRSAAQEFQKANGYAADGYPDRLLLRRLESLASSASKG